MKMRMLDRVLLTLYTLVILFFSIFLMFLSLNVINIDQLISNTHGSRYVWPTNFIMLITALLFAVVSLRLLVSGFISKKPNSTLLRITDLGIIKVSVNTLDNLTQKAVRSFDEVKEVKSIILPEPDGVKVQLKITILPDVKMPDLTKSIQTKVKEYIEELSGIAVREVQIYIENLSIPPRTRVE